MVQEIPDFRCSIWLMSVRTLRVKRLRRSVSLRRQNESQGKEALSEAISSNGIRELSKSSKLNKSCVMNTPLWENDYLTLTWARSE